MSAMALAEILGRLRPADVLLFGWIGLLWPLSTTVLGGTERGLGAVFEEGTPVRGFVWLLAVIGALAVAVTRNEGDPPARQAFDQGPLYGPLFGAILLVAGGATSGLGFGDGLGFGVAFIAMVVVAIIAGFRPLPRSTRALLVLPFILITTGIFVGTMADFGLGPDLFRDALGATAESIGVGAVVGGLALSLGLFVAVAAVFYPMLVIAPRTLVDQGVDGRSWLVRFVLFTIGSMLGLTWLVALGG